MSSPPGLASLDHPPRNGEGDARRKPAKLSYKDARRLEELEGLLAALPDQIGVHDQALSDPDLYARDPRAFDRHMTAAAAAREKLAAAEEEWLELEAKKEALAG